MEPIWNIRYISILNDDSMFYYGRIKNCTGCQIFFLSTKRVWNFNIRVVEVLLSQRALATHLSVIKKRPWHFCNLREYRGLFIELKYFAGVQRVGRSLLRFNNTGNVLCQQRWKCPLINLCFVELENWKHIWMFLIRHILFL